MGKKYQVFISSTYEDLKDQRDAVVKAVLEMGHLPVGMEMFQAGDITQWETIKSHIDKSDYYVVILAHRYGSKGNDGISYTEMEFDYAGQRKVPRLGFIIDKDADNWPPKHVEAEAKKELDAFKHKLGSARVVKFWKNTDQLAGAVFKSLSHEITINPGVGWVRATEASSPQVAEELARLSRENANLMEKLAQINSVDELSEMLGIITKRTYSFELDACDHYLSLRKAFLIACANQHTSGPWVMQDAVKKELRGGKAGHHNGLAFEAVGEGLEELGRLGLLEAIRNVDGYPYTWPLTELGRRLYRQIMYADLSGSAQQEQ